MADFVDVPEKQTHQRKRGNTFVQFEKFEWNLKQEIN